MAPAAAFAIKAEVRDITAARFDFQHQKTMYGGKTVAPGDPIFIFASENDGGRGLIAKGVVTAKTASPRAAAARQTPRVSIIVKRTGSARRSFGRPELREHRDWADGSPESELNFKFYRQATNKIVGLSAAATAFLESYF